MTFYEVDDSDCGQPSDTMTNGLGHILEIKHILINCLSGDASSISEHFEGEILAVLALYFGYTPLISVPLAPVVAKEVDHR